MYAVIRTGGKQYKVAPEDVLQIEKIEGAAGDAVQFAEVLMVGGEGDASFGSPLVSGAAVSAEVVEQGRGPKIIIFKKRRRQNYRRKKGHRQELTTVRILEILTGGRAPSRAAKEASAEEAAPAPAVQHEEAGEAKPAKARTKKAEVAPEKPAEAAAAEPEVKKAKSAKKSGESAEAKPAAPKKPRAKKSEE